MYAVHEIRQIKCDHSGFYGAHDVPAAHTFSISIKTFPYSMSRGGFV